ncbi:MAG: hypothetical protein WC450_07245 [Candidatus Omnitrophota bacterium]|jgi:hypothetical protein
MTIEKFFNETDGGLIVNGSGTITGQDIIDFNNALYSGTDPTQIKYQLCDFTKVEKIEVSNDQIQTLAEQDRAGIEKHPHQLIAIVGEKKLVYGLARMWEAYTEPIKSQRGVFKTRMEARRWLNERLSQL